METIEITKSEYEQLIRDSECLRMVCSLIEAEAPLLSGSEVIKVICGIRVEDKA